MAPVRVFLAVEDEAISAGPETPVWHPPTIAADLSLRHVLSHLRSGGIVPAEPRHRRVSMPQHVEFGNVDAETPPHLLSAVLKPAEKHTLDLVFNWPWITAAQIAGMQGVFAERVRKMLGRLVECGLVEEVLVEESRRWVVTDRGLGLLARRDRTLLSVLRSRWSAALQNPSAPHSGRNVAGRITRQLLRNLEHTDAVYGFMAGLAAQARTHGWEVVQLNPAFRASRYFTYEGRRYAVHPDAFGILSRGERLLTFFLEWERRAVRPATMSER